MRKITKSSIISMLAFVVGMTASVARSEEANAREDVSASTGPYVGAGAGRFSLKPRNFDDLGVAATSIEHADTLAWTVFAGYRFSPHWRLEGAYIDFGEPDATYLAATGSASANYRVKMSGISPNLVATLPIGPLEVFGKLGYYLYQIQTRISVATGMMVESSKMRSDLLYSAGLGMHIKKHVSAHLEYERVNIKNADTSYAMWFTGLWKF